MRKAPPRAWRTRPAPDPAPSVEPQTPDPLRRGWGPLEVALQRLDPRLCLARPAQSPSLMALARELAATEWSDPLRDPVPPLTAFVEDPQNGLPLIILEEQQVLGLCLLQRMAAPLDGGGQLCLDDLYVLRRARGRGLGALLLRGADRISEALGLRYLYLHVEPENAAAQALYARAGLQRAEAIVMDKLYF